MNFKENESAQKLRGGYYTPVDLAQFLARWVAVTKPATVLEPSCGDGVFFEALAVAGQADNASVTAFELSEEEAAKARARARDVGLTCANVRAQDFLGWAAKQLGDQGERFDAVVGNPPFVRYQYLPAPFQTQAELIFRSLGQKFTKHTNAWVPFVMAGLALLKPGGRLAMVVPAEIIHVTHAQSLRTLLGRECSRLVIIDPEELWFRDTLQGAVLLLAEKRLSRRHKAEGVGIYPVRNREFLKTKPETIFRAPQSINGKTVEGKWTRALLDEETRELFDELSGHRFVHRFSDIASVDVGIVTGANKYFLVSNEVVEEYGLQDWAHPMFGRSEHCPGVVYDEAQHSENVRKGNPTNFLWFKGARPEVNPQLRDYIRLGEEQKLHTRFKCRVRSPWYTVPSVYSTEIGMLKRCHDTPRLIYNQIGAFTTDTAYRVRSKVPPNKLVSSFVNPFTALSAELEGRHYGGGVLELIPSEIEKLFIPLPPNARISLGALDKAVRTTPADSVLLRQGAAILGALGLPDKKQQALLAGWRSLRDRRHRISSEGDVDAD